MQAVAYRIVRLALWATLGLWLRLSVRGADRVPTRGPVVLAANHRNAIDPLLVGLAAPRPVAFMAKAELFDVFFVGAFARLVYAFPVHRGAGDRAALRAAGKILDDGGTLGIFPEGTRQVGPALGTPQQGAAMLALAHGAPIVPVAIIGTDLLRKRAFPPPKVRICFGEPIAPEVGTSDRRREMQRLTTEMMASLAREGGFPG